MRSTVTEHGYLAYTYGCRCEICRQAKADYMRDRRQQSRLAAADKSADTSFLHGTRAGYEEHGCRCGACRTARRTRGKPTSRRVSRCRGCGYRWCHCCCPGGPRGGAQ